MTESQSITEAVKALYEKHPYPHYPLFAKPRWQDGYLTSSLFAQTLGNGTPPAPPPRSHEVLIAGSGEVLPYIMRHWEPASIRLTAVDLSARSLRRARIRLGLTLAKTDFVKDDINTFLDTCRQTGRTFRHVEAFGMLHHLPDPDLTLALLAQQLEDGGTMRAMVYNGTSRRWIHQIQNFLRALEFSASTDRSVAEARDLIAILAKSSSYYAQRLSQMGPGILNNRTRFADAFLHPHEVRWNVAQWLEGFSRAGFNILGIFDRFGELDDLPNPLYSPPDPDALEVRAADLRFENNLEVFLSKNSTVTDASLKPARRLKLMLPPHLWFSFPETGSIKPLTRLTIWHFFINHLAGSVQNIPAGILKLPDKSLQRLARLGALPVTARMPESMRRLLLAPMVAAMDPPQVPEKQKLSGTPLDLTIRRRFPEKEAERLLNLLVG